MTTRATEPGLACPHTFEAVDWRKVAERLAYQVVLAEHHPVGPGCARTLFSRWAATGNAVEVSAHRLIVEAESRYPSEVTCR